MLIVGFIIILRSAQPRSFCVPLLLFLKSSPPPPPCHVPVTLPREICTECFERLVSNIVQGDKMLHFAFFICIIILIPLTKG